MKGRARIAGALAAAGLASVSVPAAADAAMYNIGVYDGQRADGWACTVTLALDYTNLNRDVQGRVVNSCDAAAVAVIKRNGVVLQQVWADGGGAVTRSVVHAVGKSETWELCGMGPRAGGGCTSYTSPGDIK